MSSSKIPDRRTTGRTTRMLEKAKELSAQGKMVFILVSSDYDLLRMREKLGAECPATIELLETANLNVFTLKKRGLHYNHTVLIDHEAIRANYLCLLEEYFSYNEVTRAVWKKRLPITAELADQVNTEINEVLARYGLIEKEVDGKNEQVAN